MKDSKNKAIKAGFWYTVSNFFVKGLAFITMPIFTRLMTKSDIGMFSNITSWFNILAIITTFELFSSVNIARFDYKDDLDDYISSNLVLGSIITLFFYAIVLIFKDFFMNLFLMDFRTINIIFIYLLCYPALQMYQIRSQIRYDYKKIIFISILNSILSTIISIVLVLFMDNQLNGRIYGYFFPLIVSSIVIYIMLLKKGKKISKKYWKYSLIISFPLIWHLLAGYLLSAADKVMITKMISPDANALYSVSYTLSSIATILWMSMNNAWSPWAYEQMEEKKYDNLKNNSKPYLILFIVIVFGMMLFTPELIRIMAGKDYVVAKYVIPPVMVGYIFQFVYSLYVNIEFYHKKQKNIAIGTIIAAIINIVLNFIFIPRYGYIAAAYTTLIGYMSLFIIHFLFVKRLKCTRWYDTKFFLTILAISLLFMFVCNILYTYNTIRYLFVVLLLVVVLVFTIKNAKNIINAIKNKSIEDLISIIKVRKVSK